MHPPKQDIREISYSKRLSLRGKGVELIRHTTILRQVNGKAMSNRL